MKKRLTIKERIRITKRGIGVLKQYCPGLAGGKAVSALLSAVQPLVSIWLSAKIINELAGERRMKQILFLWLSWYLRILWCYWLRVLWTKYWKKKKPRCGTFLARYLQIKPWLWIILICRMPKFCSRSRQYHKIYLCSEMA